MIELAECSFWHIFFLAGVFLSLFLCKPVRNAKNLPSYVPLQENASLHESSEKFESFFSSLKARKTSSIDDISFEESAQCVRNLARSGFFTHVDLLRENASKLFFVHRDRGCRPEGGAAVRTTVQLNLFGGSVANLGSRSHCLLLDEIFRKGELGCFALTETGAGVLSGLIVETTATWTPEGYILHTPTHTAAKTWISQGLVARWAVVIARLLLPASRNPAARPASEGKGLSDHGPHAFLIDMCETKVDREDMTRKTGFNGLDNANLRFNLVCELKLILCMPWLGFVCLELYIMNT